MDVKPRSFQPRFAVAALAAAFFSGIVPQAQAADVADFYRGKTINVVIGYPAGGGYDVFARLLVQSMGRHIPGNPTLVPQNMPGAGSRKALLYLYEIAPKDGATFGTVGRMEPVAPLLENDTKLDARKLAWIGSIANDDSICFAWTNAAIKSWQDVATRQFTVGGLAPGDNTVMIPLLLKNLFGGNMRLVTGYPGTTDVFLAIERGEVEGACGVSWRPILTQHRDWIAGNKIKVLIEVALEKDPSLGDTPLITEFVRTADQLSILNLLLGTQAMARPFLAPPGIPEDRKQALRTAFDQTMTDPQFLADAERTSLYVHPMSGSDIDDLLAQLYATPKEVVEKAGNAIRN